MGRFARILEAVRTNIPAVLSDGALHFYSDEEQDKWPVSAPPAIGMLMIDDSYAAPRMGQGGAGERGSLWSADTRIRWRVWGESLDAADELRRQLIAALHAVAYGSYRLEGGQWNTRGVTKVGVTYSFTMTLQIPIVRNAEVSVELNEFTPEDGAIDPILET